MDDQLDPTGSPPDKVTPAEILAAVSNDDPVIVAIGSVLTEVVGNIAYSKEGQNLTTVGQILRLAEINGELQAAIDRKNLEILQMQRTLGTDAMTTAKGLLAESFKWLQSFNATAPLRQRIKLFLG